MGQTKVVAAIIKKNNLFLIVQRNRNKHLGLKWEFPGGKVLSNETSTDALIREVKEELNLTINVQEKIAEEKYKDDKIDIVLHYFLCTARLSLNIIIIEHMPGIVLPTHHLLHVSSDGFGYRFQAG